MKVFVESVLDAAPEAVWAEVQTSRLLLEVVQPLVALQSAGTAAFPERWIEGTVLRCRSYLLGILPLGTRTLTFQRIDQEARELQTREHDPLIRRWDHLIRVVAAADGRTRYSDEIEIDAGVLTLPVSLFAQWFYRHRQRRWRLVASRLNREAAAPR